MATETISINREWLTGYVAQLAPDAILRVLDSLVNSADEHAIIRAIVAGADMEDGRCPLPARYGCGSTGETGHHTAGLPSEVCNCECHREDCTSYQPRLIGGRCADCGQPESAHR